MALILGVDGCRGGWCAVPVESGPRIAVGDPFVVASFVDLIKLEPAVIAVDMPIGVPDSGYRVCDLEARSRLGRAWPRVFMTPVRAALEASEYREACLANQRVSGRQISRQCFGILPKIREVDDGMTPERQGRVFEAHPELAFAALNGGQAVLESKKGETGRALRWRLLRSAFRGLPEAPTAFRPLGCAVDDYIDALAVAWTGICISRGTAHRIPEAPATDAKGLRMEIWMPGMIARGVPFVGPIVRRRLSTPVR
jgi:predicted RNase H-like nuclease